MKMINENVLEFYFIEETVVHISHSSGDFFNGKITQFHEKKKFIVLNDRVMGNIPIMFEDIYKIKPFTEGVV